MILDQRCLEEIGFLAIARLEPGKELESHIDPMEEIYFVLSGTGVMHVDDEKQQVNPGDATWIPVGSAHSLLNNGTEPKFSELCKLCDFYFGEARQSGSSHRVYKTPWSGDPRANIQDSKGKAKLYQVRQVLKAIERLEVESGNKK